MKLKKIITLSLILILPLFSLTGCTKGNSIEDLAYVIAIGIDKGENNLLKLSLQFATPSSSSPNESSSSSSESTISSTECSSIDSGINLINSYISKKINLAHCKVVVFSEKIASSGIADELYSLINNVQIRPDCSLIVSKCNAYDFLNNSKPVLINLVERYYEVVVTSGNYTGYSTDIKLIDFYSHLKEESIEPTAILGGINTKKMQKESNNTNLIDKDSSYKAGTAPVQDKNNLEIMGLAVFKNDKLVGELNGIETISHLLVTGKAQNFNINIPDPFNQNHLITLSAKEIKKTKSTVNLINNSPYITLNIYLEANILSLNDNSDYSTPENLEIIGKYANSYLENHISNYLYKTSKEYNSDISGFGRKTLYKYATINNWSAQKWQENYKNSVFKVNVKTSVKNSALVLKK